MQEIVIKCCKCGGLIRRYKRIDNAVCFICRKQRLRINFKIKTPYLKTRFKLFSRDNFTCQYCGRSAPSVVLQPDHVIPKSRGGKDILSNLVTSCKECNAGKADTLLALHIKKAKKIIY